MLPLGWINTSIGETFTVILGQSPPSSTYNEEGNGLPFFQGKREFGEIYPTIKKWCSAPKKIAEEGDTLLSVRAPVGPTNIAPERCCIGRGLASIRPIAGIPSRFVFYLLRSQMYGFIGKGTGTTFEAITGDHLKGYPIYLPPLPEQLRIVAKIEELFTKLDAGVVTLKQVQMQLKRYRQSVLKAAVEGKLTAEWREQHKNEIEPAYILLEQIQEHRKEKLGKKYKEPKPVDITDLPELPEGWIWTNLKQLTDPIKKITYGVLKPGDHFDDGVPLIKSQHVREFFVLKNVTFKISKELDEKYSRTRIRGGEILLNLVGASIGRCAIAPDIYNGFNVSRAVAVIRPLNIKSRFVLFALRKFLTGRMIGKLSGGVAQPVLNLSVIENIPIPIPPLGEQAIIINKVEQLFSIINESVRVIRCELERAQSLRESTLKRAFQGRLVSQDPRDEPASALLKRIKKQKPHML